MLHQILFKGCYEAQKSNQNIKEFYRDLAHGEVRSVRSFGGNDSALDFCETHTKPEQETI